MSRFARPKLSAMKCLSPSSRPGYYFVCPQDVAPDTVLIGHFVQVKPKPSNHCLTHKSPCCLHLVAMNNQPGSAMMIKTLYLMTLEKAKTHLYKSRLSRQWM